MVAALEKQLELPEIVTCGFPLKTCDKYYGMIGRRSDICLSCFLNNSSPFSKAKDVIGYICCKNRI
jgi:hypothetical protein